MLPNNSNLIPEWEIEKGEFLSRLGLEDKDFVKHLRLPDLGPVKHIVPLRFMAQVEQITPISKELTKFLLSRMKTMNGHRPFLNSKISLTQYFPKNLKVGQKYAYAENLTSVLSGLPAFFDNFMIPSGVSELGCWFLFGKDIDGISAMACYMPPIVERHGKKLVIMDGIHRNYIAKQFGVSINVILVEDISIPFPCGMREWDELQVISLNDKPKDINERYFDLTKELFRDLKYLGIDG